MTVNSALARAAILIVCLCRASECSLFDPHLFPSKGPFFEGWYLRLTDFTRTDSFGLLFGNVLPASSEEISGPLVLASILRRKCDAGSTCKLVSTNGAYNISDLIITERGKNVTKDPALQTPADFHWEVYDGETGGFLTQRGNITEAYFRLKDISFKLSSSDRVPWNADGTGPEGWLGRYFPLPLHWFVFSLRSKLDYYEIQNITSGEVIKGSDGVVHMEKNWGKSFPRKWIWSEGVQKDNTNASFALSGGLVDFPFHISLHAYLIGYRNPSAGISIDFRPVTSFVTANIDGCLGSVSIKATSLSGYRVQITISAKNSTFSSCLYGPESTGFQRACVESYDAIATFEISKYTFLPFMFKTVDKQVFRDIGLEFGGGYVCGEACNSA